MNTLLYLTPYYFGKPYLLNKEFYKIVNLPLLEIAVINKNELNYDHSKIKKILSWKSKIILNNHIKYNLKYKQFYNKYSTNSECTNLFWNNLKKNLNKKNIPVSSNNFNQSYDIGKYLNFDKKFIKVNENLNRNKLNSLLIKVNSGKKVWKSKLTNNFRDIIINNLVDNCVNNFHVEITLDYNLLALYPNNKKIFEEELILGFKKLDILQNKVKIDLNKLDLKLKNFGNYVKFMIQNDLNRRYIKIIIFIDYYLKALNIYQKEYFIDRILIFMDELNKDDFDYFSFFNNVKCNQSKFYYKRRYLKEIMNFKLFPEFEKFLIIILNEFKEEGIFFLLKTFLEKLHKEKNN